jgi:phosphinothricin acetyltransferase
MSRSEGLLLRPAIRTDAVAICAIYNAAIAERSSTFETEPRSPRELEGRIGDARFPLLVGDGECSVYVAGEARGRGVGTALMEALASAAEAGGFHKLIGKLFTDNVASLRLVERCGFSSVGLHRRHGRLDGTWRDVLVVERLLSPADRWRSHPSSSRRNTRRP